MQKVSIPGREYGTYELGGSDMNDGLSSSALPRPLYVCALAAVMALSIPQQARAQATPPAGTASPPTASTAPANTQAPASTQAPARTQPPAAAPAPTGTTRPGTAPTPPTAPTQPSSPAVANDRAPESQESQERAANEAVPPSEAGDGSPAPSSAADELPGAPDSSVPDTEAPATDPVPAPDPTRDARELGAQGAAGPEVAAQALVVAPPSSATREVEAAPIPDAIFAEDWWTHARPIVELHGNLRTRAELFYNYSLGRVDLPSVAMWARPADNRFLPEGSEEIGPRLCTGAETSNNSDSTDARNLFWCDNETQAGANLRLRLNPEVHVSDNLRIHAQVDLFDNLVLGSTPSGYRFASGTDGMEVVTRGGSEP